MAPLKLDLGAMGVLELGAMGVLELRRSLAHGLPRTKPAAPKPPAAETWSC